MTNRYNIDILEMRDGFEDYIRLDNIDIKENYELMILSNNDISGLLNVRPSNDGIRYIINGYTDFATAFFRSANVGSLIALVYRRMVELLKGIDDYTLRADGVLISEKSIFVNEDASDVAFLYVPGTSFQVKDDFISFTEYIMKNMNHKDDEAVLLGYGIYSVVRQEHYEIGDVLTFIDDHENKAADKEDAVIPDVKNDKTKKKGVSLKNRSDKDVDVKKERPGNQRKTAIKYAGTGLKDSFLTNAVKKLIANIKSDKAKLKQAVIVVVTSVVVMILCMLDLLSSM